MIPNGSISSVYLSSVVAPQGELLYQHLDLLLQRGQAQHLLLIERHSVHAALGLHSLKLAKLSQVEFGTGRVLVGDGHLCERQEALHALHERPVCGAPVVAEPSMHGGVKVCSNA